MSTAISGTATTYLGYAAVSPNIGSTKLVGPLSEIREIQTNFKRWDGVSFVFGGMKSNGI